MMVCMRKARVAEMVDALDLGSSVIDVGVQVPSLAPDIYNPNQLWKTFLPVSGSVFLYLGQTYYQD